MWDLLTACIHIEEIVIRGGDRKRKPCERYPPMKTESRQYYVDLEKMHEIERFLDRLIGEDAEE